MRISPRPGEMFTEKYHQYGKMLYKIAVLHLGSKEDAEEAVQEAFMKLLYKAPEFRNDEHEKAWLIRVLINQCHNMTRSVWKKRTVVTSRIEDFSSAPEDRHMMESVLALPFKLKAVIHLHYYEDYSIKQIAETLNIKESAVKMRLARGRQLLKLELEAIHHE
ncbi:RNA polymerase sigma factor [Gorillibacterium massiliense]|uniref:RNA polymerase sigma factor n=1 Tax=Gorillibacterium massiliense TaxID=1280390 RepID=UPI0004B2663A|nr:sigma-70 family RNA polymerase sigma factor [Gorillibacterium massiliense]